MDANISFVEVEIILFIFALPNYDRETLGLSSECKIEKRKSSLLRFQAFAYFCAAEFVNVNLMCSLFTRPIKQIKGGVGFVFRSYVNEWKLETLDLNVTLLANWVKNNNLTLFTRLGKPEEPT